MSQSSASGPPVASLLGRALKVHIVGPPGSGKTWLARKVGAKRGWPVHHLDKVGHIAGGGSQLRPNDELLKLVRDIQTAEAWICEGVDLGWTEPLLEAADAIIWLDNGHWWVRGRNILQRFAVGAASEALGQRGWRRWARVGDYVSRLRELVEALRQSRRYDSAGGEETRSAFEVALQLHQDKVVRCPDRDACGKVMHLLCGLDPV